MGFSVPCSLFPVPCINSSSALGAGLPAARSFSTAVKRLLASLRKLGRRTATAARALAREFIAALGVMAAGVNERRRDPHGHAGGVLPLFHEEIAERGPRAGRVRVWQGRIARKDAVLNGPALIVEAPSPDGTL